MAKKSSAASKKAGTQSKSKAGKGISKSKASAAGAAKAKASPRKATSSASAKKSATSPKRASAGKTKTATKRTAAPKRPAPAARSTAARRTATPPPPRAKTASRSKVGSGKEAAQKIGGRGDFGIPAQGAGKRNNPDAMTTLPRAGADEDRISGVGGVSGGPGNSSGGDISQDFVGVAGAAGLTESAATDVTNGPASTTGGSEEFASGQPVSRQGTDRTDLTNEQSDQE